jgi:hypothetical protein
LLAAVVMGIVAGMWAERHSKPKVKPHGQ